MNNDLYCKIFIDTKRLIMSDRTVEFFKKNERVFSVCVGRVYEKYR